MASGDLKGNNEVIVVTAGAAVVLGDLVHIEADGKWDPCTTADYGKFGVAIDAAAADGDLIRVCVKGKVEVKATAATIAKGEYVIAGTTGFVVKAGTLDATSIVGTIVGYAYTAFTSGGQGIIDLMG